MTDYTKLEELYREWNAKINVISRKDIDNIREHHVMHSLAIAEYLRRFYGEDGWKAGESVLDVGTGGGFPGIPLAMEFPELKFTLCDSIGKKILVARSVAEALGLQNVECVNARAEAVPGEFTDSAHDGLLTVQSNFRFVEFLVAPAGEIDCGGRLRPERHPIGRNEVAAQRRGDQIAVGRMRFE